MEGKMRFRVVDVMSQVAGNNNNGVACVALRCLVPVLGALFEFGRLWMTMMMMMMMDEKCDLERARTSFALYADAEIWNYC
jgi:hypothetical protein